jgi:transcriptional antiterminator RfaH
VNGPVAAPASSPAAPASSPAAPASSPAALDGAPGAHAGWYVVFTKARQEQTALENLLRQGYQAYLPRIGKWTRHRAPESGWTCTTQPMFPRYLFVQPTAQQQSLAPVRSTRGALWVVRFGDAPPTVPETLVEALRRIEADTAEPPSPIRTGSRVKVVSGPLAGLEGLVTASAARRVELLLSLLGRDSTVALDTDAVVPVDD